MRVNTDPHRCCRPPRCNLVHEVCVPVPVPRPPLVVDGSSGCWAVAAAEQAATNLGASRPGSRVVSKARFQPLVHVPLSYQKVQDQRTD